MPQNLIRFFKDGRKCWVKQGKLFILTLPDKVVVFPVALFHLEKSRNHNYIKARVFEVQLYVASYSECLRASKLSNLQPSCKRFCRDCFTNKSVCDNHTDLYDTWNCDVHPCETCARLFKECKSLACRQFCNLLLISDQEPA